MTVPEQIRKQSEAVDHPINNEAQELTGEPAASTQKLQIQLLAMKVRPHRHPRGRSE